MTSARCHAMIDCLALITEYVPINSHAVPSIKTGTSFCFPAWTALKPMKRPEGFRRTCDVCADPIYPISGTGCIGFPLTRLCNRSSRPRLHITHITRHWRWA